MRPGECDAISRWCRVLAYADLALGVLFLFRFGAQEDAYRQMREAEMR